MRQIHWLKTAPVVMSLVLVSPLWWKAGRRARTTTSLMSSAT